MIYEIEHFGGDLEYYEGTTIYAGAKLFINTKNIVTIEKYYDENYIHQLKVDYKLDASCFGLLINGIKTPLFLIENYDKEECAFYDRLDEASNRLDCIFEEIIKIMKREAI